MKIYGFPVSHVRSLFSAIGNFQIGKIYAKAKVHYQGKFAPRKINPLNGINPQVFPVKKPTMQHTMCYKLTISF